MMAMIGKQFVRLRRIVLLGVKFTFESLLYRAQLLQAS
jgi:aspartate/glutamate racemase